MNDIDEAYTLLNIFCDKFQKKYGSENWLANMVMSLHLKKFIKDYGLVYGFWCVSFERCNGVHRNNNETALQLMMKVASGCQLQCDKIVHESGFSEIEST